MTRIPHTDSPTEVRQAFQQLTLQTDVITTGAVGYILVGGGVGVAPIWQIVSLAIDHGAIGGLGDDDHAIYLKADGTRNLTDDLAVTALKTIDGRDISVDGAVLDILVGIAGKVAVDSGATPGFLGAAAGDGVLRTSTGLSYADGGNFITVSLDINSLAAAAIAAGDFVPFWDITATATNKKILFSGFEAALNHNALTNYVAARHIDWTNATDDFLTAGTGKFISGAADVLGFEIDGDTNPFVTSTTSCGILEFSRTVDITGTLNSYIGFKSTLTLDHTDAEITVSQISMGTRLWLENSGSVTNEGANNLTYGVRDTYCHLADTGTYDTTSTGKIYANWYGTRVVFDTSPTFTDSGGVASDDAKYYTYGQAIYITNNPTLTSGGLSQLTYGLYVRIEGNTVGTSFGIGMFIYSVEGYDSNYAIYDTSGATWALWNDNQKFRIGAAIDASIYYDGADFIINPREVGTGLLSVLGAGKFTLDAADVLGFEIDGITNPFVTSATACQAAKISREIDYNSGDLATLAVIHFDIDITNADTQITGDRYLRSLFSDFNNSGTITNETAGHCICELISGEFLFTDSGTYNTTSTGGVYCRPVGQLIDIDCTPTFTATGGAGSQYLIYGQKIEITSSPTLSSGTLIPYLHGIHITLTGTTVGSSKAYGIRIQTVTGCDDNYAIYDLSGANWSVQTDNQKIFWGTARDASIYYDGTNFCIDPKEVGTGYLDVKGGITADGTIAGTTITGANVTSGVDPGHTHGGAGGGGWSPTAASVYLSADQSIDHNTETVIQFDSESFDPGNNFNTGTYRYTVPSTGYYLIIINAWMLMTIGDMLVIHARKGAGGLGSGDYLCYVSTTTSRNGGVVISGSRIVYMTAAEYIEFVIYQNTGVAQNLEHDDPALTCATITRLA